ncbi:MAG TPA: hypothetical protein VMG12_42040 [Polyangiaceae bacterium]|nr:hypothetical protein [Polyangiaceae bacterium]
MIDQRGLEHRLALARLGISPSDAAKARVLEGLAGAPEAASPRGAGARAPSPVRTSVFTAPRVALLMGISLAVGYGLGLHGVGAGDEANAPSERRGAPLGLGTPPPPSLPLPAPAQATPAGPPEPASPPLAAPGADRAVAVEVTPPRAARANPRSALRRSALRREALRNDALQRDARRAMATHARHDELALLRRIERALRSRQAELGLALLDELEQRHPRSTLLEERSAARVLAECLLPRDGARASAERFVVEHPASVYADRIRQACEPSTHLLEKDHESADTDGPKEVQHENQHQRP